MGVNLFSQATRSSSIMWFSFVIAVSSIFMSEQLFLRSSYTTRFSGKYYNSSSSLNITNLGDGSGSNVTKEAIIGIFDAVSGLTHGIGDVLEEFEHGLNDDNETVIEKKQDEAEDPADESETVVLGLFDTLVDFTKQVGKLVNIVGDRLDDRRDDVVKIATSVDDQVNNLGENIIDWKMKHLGIKKDTSNLESEEIEDEEDLILDVIDEDKEDNEETTDQNVLEV